MLYCRRWRDGTCSLSGVAITHKRVRLLATPTSETWKGVPCSFDRGVGSFTSLSTSEQPGPFSPSVVFVVVVSPAFLGLGRASAVVGGRQ